MGFVFPDTGEAASVYLGLYVIYVGLASYIVFKRGWKTVYTGLLVYGLVRVGGQISGIGFANEGDTNYRWLIAYLVLQAEGYFMLVVSSMYLLIKQQRKHFGTSYLADNQWGRFTFLTRKSTVKAMLYYILVVANVLLVSGSTMLSGMDPKELETEKDRVAASKGLRTAGQALFLVLSLCINFAVFYDYAARGLKNKPVMMMLIAAPFITVRGIFGVLSIHIERMDYMSISNYFSSANHRSMTIFEYVLGITMEFITGFILLNTHWFDTDKSPKDKEPLVDDKSVV